MPPLRDVLTALAQRPEVAGALVVSDEGLVIEASLPAGLDPETVAAHAATALRALGDFTQSLRHPASDQVLVDGADGSAILHRLPSGATLVVLARRDGDLASLLLDLRRHGPAIAELV